MIGGQEPPKGQKKKHTVNLAYHLIARYFYMIRMGVAQTLGSHGLDDTPRAPHDFGSPPHLNLRMAPTNCSTPYNHKMSIEERGLFALHVAVAILTHIGEH